MDVYKLVEKLGGEICRGRARVRVGGQIVVVGVLNGDYMEFTEEGRKLAADGDKPVAEKPKRGARPAKADVVESEPVTLLDEALQDSLFPEPGLT